LEQARDRRASSGGLVLRQGPGSEGSGEPGLCGADEPGHDRKRLRLEPAGGEVDATLSADPVAFLMVGSGRLSRYEAVALGAMTVGGNRPDLAFDFPTLFAYP
jgi:hypothetical protein